jgi:hypothetical protein
LVLFQVTVTTQPEAKPIRVVVLDALDGKPQSGVKVEYFCSGPPPNEVPVPIKRMRTDAEGVAVIHYRCSGEKELELSAIPDNRKEQCGGPLLFGLEEISTGIISDPTADGGIWCPTKISRKLKPAPGQVIIFVKKPTWWQSHIAG